MGFKSLEFDLFYELENTPTIDAHEHIASEEERLKEGMNCIDLFTFYTWQDLLAAGASEEYLLEKCLKGTLVECWKNFKPYFDKVRTGSYAGTGLLAVKDLYGIEELNDYTVQVLDQRMKLFNTKGFYEKILGEKCNIKACIQCWKYGEIFPEYFYHLASCHEITDITSVKQINELEKEYNVSISNLNELLECLDLIIKKWSEDKTVVGIKSAHGGGDTCKFCKRSRAEAESIFDKIIKEGNIDFKDARPIVDYLMFELIARAEQHKLPMAFHTGLQSVNNKRILDSHPLNLQELIENFPNEKIDIFHAGTPWFRETAILAKYFPNVYLNLAWNHIISPSQARLIISEWIDILPNNKIFGFGGDHRLVEKVYAHLKIARQNIARVLAEKVMENTLSRSDASMLIKNFMYENPKNFYNLPV